MLCQCDESLCGVLNHSWRAYVPEIRVGRLANTPYFYLANNAHLGVTLATAWVREAGRIYRTETVCAPPN
jgi:hypothetical protein